MIITLSSGDRITIPGCFTRFGTGFGILGDAYDLTHNIRRGKVYQVTGPAGCKCNCLGTVEKIEV